MKYYVSLFVFYGISPSVGYLMLNLFLQIISTISNNSVYNTKTVLFQTIQFSISTQFFSIWAMDRTLSGATTPNQSGPESDGNKGVLRISQSSSITGTLPSDCLVSYLGHSLERGFTPLQRSSQCILQLHSTGQIFRCVIINIYNNCHIFTYDRRR